MSKVIILGSGMAAWGAYDRLVKEGLDPILFDAKDIPAGHTASYRLDNGFVFDDGPHISFSKIQETIDLFEESVDGEYEAFSAYVDNYFEGSWVEHPVIVNMNELPGDLAARVMDDFRSVYKQPVGEIGNYLEWLIAAYGETYARTFPAVYGQKYHTCKAEQMNTDWMGPRLYQPDIKEVERGLEQGASADAHYIKEFRYPKVGGFQSYLDRFIEKAKPRLSHEAVAVDAKNKTVTFGNGSVESYDYLISSVPLPTITPMVKGVPDHILAAAQQLSCSQCVLVNIGVGREDLSPAHWRYIYDTDLDAVRLSFPHMFSKTVVPAGCGSVQAEVYFSDKYKPFDGDIKSVVSRVIENLRTMGILKPDDDIVYQEGRWVPWANIIFDLDTKAALSQVHAFLDENGIEYCGRYGDWAYIWTDESYISGQTAAQSVLDRIAS